MKPARNLIQRYQFERFCSTLVVTALAEAVQSCDFIVADTNTAALLPFPPDFVLPAGEQHKTLTEIELLIGAFAARHLSRDTAILAFGGGILCDLVGFAVASYMRGCGLILVPTTLLAMVDAALGGKTGCNYQDYKNLIGAFYPAREIRIVPEVLATLPPREFQSGLAELCKHALLSDSDTLWNNLQRGQSSLRAPSLQGENKVAIALSLQDLIIEGVQVKGRIVERDLYEEGERAFLNLGHTYAHALEKVSAFECTHGEAVAWGINQALRLSAAQGYCSVDYAVEVKNFLVTMGFVLDLHELCPALLKRESPAQAAKKLLQAMALDKKKHRQVEGIRLVLQRGRGQTFVTELPAELVQDTLQL